MLSEFETEFHPFTGMGGIQPGFSVSASVSRLQFFFFVATVPFYSI
jgi:hypothetical protein